MKYKYRKTFTDIRGIRHDVKANTLRELDWKVQRLQEELERESSSRSSSTPFRKWAEIALDTYKPNVSLRYRGCMLSRLNRHILPVIGNYPIGRIAPIQCQEILNSMQGMSSSHIRKVAQELFFYFDVARKNKIIRDNPAAEIVRPKGYTNKRRSLTPIEREHFIKLTKKFPGKFTLFELMLYAGCRPAEAWNVRYEDVKEIEGVYYLHIRGTKTANSNRFVPICEELYPMLVKTPYKGFCALTEGGEQYNDTSYRRLSKRLKREMDISMGAVTYRNKIIESVLSNDFVPYLFRHTFCTDLKKKGVDLRLAKNLMGHADIKTTANIYDHDDNETLRMAAEQMGVSTLISTL